MRIIIANYRYFIAGGPERYMFNFMREAEKLGVECIPFSVDYAQNEKTPYSKYFVAPRGGKNQLNYKEIKLTPRNIAGLLQSSIYNFEAEKKMRQLIRDVKPDAVYILHEINSLSPSIIRAAKKENVRVVHRISDFFMFCPKLDFLCGNEICDSCIHGSYSKAIKQRCVKGSWCATLVRAFAMKVYKWLRIYDDVDKFITTCQFTKNKLIEGGIASNKIICVPTFIDSSNIAPCYENDGYFLYLGRIAEQKGVIYAVEAMKYLKNTSVKLRITGTLDASQESDKIRKIIEQEGLQEQVEFVGFQHGEELENSIKRCIAVVNPAIWFENMPNTVIEAYAFGKPVIATRIGSLAEIIEEYESGLLFEIKNSEDLATKMRLCVENLDVVVKMGQYARTLVENKYAPESHFKKVMSELAYKGDGIRINGTYKR